MQVSFDHLDLLQTVVPEEVEIVSEPLADITACSWGPLEVFKRKLAAGLIIGENNLTGGFTKAAVQPLPHQAFLIDKVFAAERFGHVLADDVGPLAVLWPVPWPLPWRMGHGLCGAAAAAATHTAKAATRRGMLLRAEAWERCQGKAEGRGAEAAWRG